MSPEVTRARELLATCRVEEVRAPVMAAPGMYLARLSHADRVITLNGHALDREPCYDEARARWIAHELFHLWRLEDRELQDRFPPTREGQVAEELAADAFAETVWNHL